MAQHNLEAGFAADIKEAGGDQGSRRALERKLAKRADFKKDGASRAARHSRVTKTHVETRLVSTRPIKLAEEAAAAEALRRLADHDPVTRDGMRRARSSE